MLISSDCNTDKSVFIFVFKHSSTYGTVDLLPRYHRTQIAQNEYFSFILFIYGSQQRSIWYHCTHQNNGGDLEIAGYCSRNASGKEIQIWNNPVCFLTQPLLQWGHLFLCVLFIVFIASARHAQLRIQTPTRGPPINFFCMSHASAARADARERERKTFSPSSASWCQLSEIQKWKSAARLLIKDE